MKDGKIMQVGSPIEIYQKPNSEFVAKFIGRANILKSKIVSRGVDGTEIEILGKIYKVKEVVEGETKERDIVVRPETVVFGEETHKGTVVKSIFMGENHEYEIEVEGQIIEAILNNPHGKEIKAVGEKIGFTFDRDAIHIIEK